MKEISVFYVAEDGEKFITKQECYEYECELKKNQNLFRALKDIKNLCSKNDVCEDCLFFDGSCCGFSNESFPMSWHLEEWKGFR